MTAVAGALWISLAGSHVVRTGITRDDRSRVGQLLAATPLPTRTYLLSEFVSNLAVLLPVPPTRWPTRFDPSRTQVRRLRARTRVRRWSRTTWRV